MRLIMIAGTYQQKHCGVADYTAHLKQKLIERGIQPIILTTHKASSAAEEDDIQGVVKQWSMAELIPLTQAIHASQADVLHIQHAAGTYGFDRAIFLLPLLLKLTGWQRPIVTTVHEYGWWEWQPKGIPPRWLEWLKNWGQQHGWWDREDGFLLTQSAAIIATNSSAEATIQARLPHLQSRVYRIPIGANVEAVSVSWRANQHLWQRYGWSSDVQVIAFFGFLHPVKGLEVLLSAFQNVLVNCPHTRLLIMGGIESLALSEKSAVQYWKQLECRISELSLNNTVRMTGYVSEDIISQNLAGADVGVLPFNHGVTLKSGSLLTLMMHALPVVATRATPPEPELEALLRLIPPRSIKALTDEMIYLLSNPELRLRLGAAAYQFSQQFSWNSIADAHVAVYQTVLQQKSTTLSSML